MAENNKSLGKNRRPLEESIKFLSSADMKYAESALVKDLTGKAHAQILEVLKDKTIVAKASSLYPETFTIDGKLETNTIRGPEIEEGILVSNPAGIDDDGLFFIATDDDFDLVSPDDDIETIDQKLFIDFNDDDDDDINFFDDAPDEELELAHLARAAKKIADVSEQSRRKLEVMFDTIAGVLEQSTQTQKAEKAKNMSEPAVKADNEEVELPEHKPAAPAPQRKNGWLRRMFNRRA